ncbi:hypothetical protein LTR56_005592 [Elasticomyces elasticus]|nr:hypothetical protein LTR56_005592 [Elasticomyces elasticus]KAK3664020.1 hypothetical protein LTR22_005240 [Elasticomyces elasticus]KAK4927332.1 hypothetical protein LTR49_005737 [Elasticomyces elasticus]KAK5763298.1 hypothetical protein LTS12_006473 [Elasticomyces elasticus]
MPALRHAYPYRISVDSMVPYLDIYHHKLFPVWPIAGVESHGLIARLRQTSLDPNAYILAASICVATILQLQLDVVGSNSSGLEPRATLIRIEHMRRDQAYREDPNLDTLAASFFLHVAYLHIGRRTTSTLLLREAISMAHLLELHKPTHYQGLSSLTTQDHLHLPKLDENAQPFQLTAFVMLCRMFTYFHEATACTQHTPRTLMILHNQLQNVPGLSPYYNDLQRADLSVTQQWMRLMFWKMAISQFNMTADPDGDIQSMLFPVRIARDLLAHMSSLSIDTLEAHGPGMELKLFEFANTVADVAVTVSSPSHSGLELGPKDFLFQLAGVLGSFRGGNNALLPLLQSRLAEVGLTVPARPRILDISFRCLCGVV